MCVCMCVCVCVCMCVCVCVCVCVCACVCVCVCVMWEELPITSPSPFRLKAVCIRDRREGHHTMFKRIGLLELVGLPCNECRNSLSTLEKGEGRALCEENIFVLL